MLRRLSSLSTLLLLLYFFFVGGLNLSRMFSRASGSTDFLQVGGRLFIDIGGAVCRQRPCGPVRSLVCWVNWIPPDLHGFYMWVFDTQEVLNDLVKRVVVVCRESSKRMWPRLLRSWLSRISLMPSLGRLGCRTSVGLVTLWSLWQEAVLELPRITGRDLLEVARAKKSTSGWMGGLGTRLRLCPLHGSRVWLLSFTW